MTCPFKRCQDETAHCDGACSGVMPDGSPLSEIPELADGVDESKCLECQGEKPCTAGPLCTTTGVLDASLAEGQQNRQRRERAVCTTSLLTERLRIYEKLKEGGEWLATLRRWLQSNVQGGDTLTWGSAQPVTLAFAKFEELGIRVAEAAVYADRTTIRGSVPVRSVVAAACKLPSGTLICSPRHFDDTCRLQLAAHRLQLGDTKNSELEQGFVDQRGVFMTREEAWVVAEAAHQIKRRVGGDSTNGGTLYSENLY